MVNGYIQSETSDNSCFSRRRFLKTSLAATLFAHTCQKQDKKPNIVFIMTDDQGPWAFSQSGDPNAKTPNIDRLAKQGAWLKNCFAVTPVCSPSRGNIMTSRYCTEFGITDYIAPERQPDLGLDPEWVTWPEIFTDNGYATALIGKWHLGQMDRYHPTRFGYQEFIGFRVGGLISKDPEIEINGQKRTVKGYTPDILTDYAIDFIQRKQDQPFLLSLHYWAPHANTLNFTPDGDRTWLPLKDIDWNPFKSSDAVLPHPDYPKLDIPRTKRMSREYLASVASADRNIGRLMMALDKLGLTNNTVVIFTSDQGYNMGHNGIWHKGNGRWLLTDNQGARPNMYDNSLRVPTVVRWPKQIKASTIIENTLTHLDWYPTLLAIAGLEPADSILIRGRNCLPLLQGKKIPWENDCFAQYPMWEWNQTGANLRSYRTPKWKLIRDFTHPDSDELYNLVNDPDETTNLIGSNDPEIKKIKKDLSDKMQQIMRDISDPVLKS